MLAQRLIVSQAPTILCRTVSHPPTCDENVRAIIHKEWILKRQFVIQEGYDIGFTILDCEGLDTFAAVYLNGILIAQTENQFRRYLLDITHALKSGANSLCIQFKDATRVAKDKADKYPYYVPDMFNMSDAQHGFPRRNMIRKEQLAPILIDRHCHASKVHFSVRCCRKQSVDVVVQLQPRDGPEQVLKTVRKVLTIDDGHSSGSVSLEVSDSIVRRWWPKGFGEQALYIVNTNIFSVCDQSQKPTTIASQRFKVGFRTCALVQRPMGDKGDSFYFAVNETPIFAKGTNWIPGHVFDQLMTPETKRYLIQSCIQANMNMIRVWGGGRYESDGKVYLVDYHKLNVETIYGMLKKFDTSRPFISSSPSAGLISNEPYTERYVLEESEKGLFGDVHFYDYKHNGLLVEHFPVSRFVSEYGAQSMPSFRLLKTVTSAEDWHPLSEIMVHRNHHGNGQQEMLQQIEFQFALPLKLRDYYWANPAVALSLPEADRARLMKIFCYLTQCAQARSIAAQTEHYRRCNGLPIHTMGALYWQLNDIWPGPTCTLSYQVIDMRTGERSSAGSSHISVPGQDSKQVGILSSEQLRDIVANATWALILAKVEIQSTNGEASSEPMVVHMTHQVYPIDRPLPISLFERSPGLAIDDFNVVETKDRQPSTLEIHFSVTATAALAGLVVLGWDMHGVHGWFSDNVFWLLKGETKAITFKGVSDRVIKTLSQDTLTIQSLTDVLLAGL
ncbi:hypothetical protein BGZ94_000842 [Podila epigama]|nr:hypothetical protein BGZ94_000842 [Podila epigama]